MSKSRELVAWDTCVIIDAIQGPRNATLKKKYEKIEPYLNKGKNGHLQVVVSEISVIECSYLKELGDDGITISEQQKLIASWFDSPFIVRVPLQPAITKIAIGLARTHRLSAADALVLATAVYKQAPVLHTGDGSRRKSGKKLLPLDGKIDGLRISQPNPDEGTLFEDMDEN